MFSAFKYSKINCFLLFIQQKPVNVTKKSKISFISCLPFEQELTAFINISITDTISSEFIASEYDFWDKKDFEGVPEPCELDKSLMLFQYLENTTKKVFFLIKETNNLKSFELHLTFSIFKCGFRILSWMLTSMILPS